MKRAREPAHVGGPARYRITLQGRLTDSWSDWFLGLAITSDLETTTLTGEVADQAALRGLLCRIWDLNLRVVSVVQVEQETGEGYHE